MLRRFRPLAIAGTAVAIAAGAATPAAGQGPRMGEWLRLSTQEPGRDPEWVVGAFAASTSMYVVVDQIAAGPLAIPHASLTRLEVQRGYTSHARIAGLLGAAIGLTVSAAVGLGADCLPLCLAAGPPLGAAVGGLFGASRIRMRWEEMSPILLRPTIRAGAPARLVMSVAF